MSDKQRYKLRSSRSGGGNNNNTPQPTEMDSRTDAVGRGKRRMQPIIDVDVPEHMRDGSSKRQKLDANDDYVPLSDSIDGRRGSKESGEISASGPSGSDSRRTGGVSSDDYSSRRGSKDSGISETSLPLHFKSRTWVRGANPSLQSPTNKTGNNVAALNAPGPRAMILDDITRPALKAQIQGQKLKHPNKTIEALISACCAPKQPCCNQARAFLRDWISIHPVPAYWVTVSGLNGDTTEQQLQQTFQECYVQEVRLPDEMKKRKRPPNVSKDWYLATAYVGFPTLTFAMTAAREKNGTMIRDRKITVRLFNENAKGDAREVDVSDSSDGGVSVGEVPSSKPSGNDYGQLARTAAKPPFVSDPKQAWVRLHDLSEDEQKLQFRYFKLFEPASYARCLSCGIEGHTESTCPQNTCAHCGSNGEHFASACPTNRKCGRCRGRGHLSQTCTNTARAHAADKCDVCGRAGHVEEECAGLWPSFPLPQMERKAPGADLRCFCYNCGNGGHYGNDCPSLPQFLKRMATLNETWSSANASKYFESWDAHLAGAYGGNGYEGAVGYGRNGYAGSYQMAMLNDMRD